MAEKTPKILIVEDEKPMAKALKLKLEKNEFQVDIASNGEEALKKIKEETYKVILLDLVMPHMNGFSFLEEMKKNKIDTPVIVASNLSQEEDIEKTKSYGVKEFLIKSDTPIQEIVKKIKNMA